MLHLELCVAGCMAGCVWQGVCGRVYGRVCAAGCVARCGWQGLCVVDCVWQSVYLESVIVAGCVTNRVCVPY